MKPNPRYHSVFGFLFVFGLMLMTAVGCSLPWMARDADLDEVVTREDDSDEPRYIGPYSAPWGFDLAKGEGIGLATQLLGTGSNPRPSPQRDHLIAEMQSHDVYKPYEVLRSQETSMVLVRGYLPPGIRKGETFDIDIRLPPKSETTSLEGGFLLPTRLRPMEILGSGVRTGHTIGIAEGPLLVDSALKGDEDGSLGTRARILGGGVALQSRPLGLSVRSGANVRTSSRIAAAINNRFDVLVRGVRQQVATAYNDRRIDLQIPRQYKHNLSRYMRVIANIAFREGAEGRTARLQLLDRQLQDPTTAAVAALRLEAIGEDGIGALQRGLSSPDLEIRFYAAESLAYLGIGEAADALAAAARNEPAFRWRALAALTSLNDVAAGESLHNLLHVPSAETRYGAFRALQTRSPNDPLTRGEKMGDGFSYHTISTVGPPMVCFSSSRRAEIVLFGLDQALSPTTLYSSEGLIIKAQGQDRIKISRFAVNGDQHETTSNRLDDVIRAVVSVGGGYSQILDFVESAKRERSLVSRVVINPLPSPRRRYIRSDADGPAGNESEPLVRPAGPIPELFRVGSEEDQRSDEDTDEEKVYYEGAEDISPEPEESETGFLGRIRGWFF